MRTLDINLRYFLDFLKNIIKRKNNVMKEGVKSLLESIVKMKALFTLNINL